MASLPALNFHTQDQFGNDVISASIEVRREDDNTLADLFSDRAGTTPIGNPFFPGVASGTLYVDDHGAFKITATQGANTTVQRYVPLGTAQELNSADVISFPHAPIEVDQAMIDAAADNAVLFFGDGSGIVEDISITRPIHFRFDPGITSVLGKISVRAMSGCSFKGHGMSSIFGPGSCLQWGGDDPASIMWQLREDAHIIFEDFYVNASANNPNRLGQAFSGISSTTPPPQNHLMWNRILIDGGSYNGLQFGFQFGNEGDPNGNNDDIHSFRDVFVLNYSVAAWSILQPEAKQWLFDNIVFLAATDGAGGQYGITTALNTGGGGSFIVRNFAGGANQIADFYLGGPDDTILISGGQSESSKRLLKTYAASGNAFPVTLENIRYAGNNIHHDGHCIIYQDDGPLIIRGCEFEGQGNPLDILLDGSNVCLGIAEGNSFINMVTTDPFIVGSGGGGDNRWTLLNNKVNNSRLRDRIRNNPLFETPSTKTGNYSLTVNDYSLIFNAAGSSTLTLQSASDYFGRVLYVKTIAAQTVVSASSNVCPIASATPGTAILPATAGAWAMLQSDGTNWIVMQRGT